MFQWIKTNRLGIGIALNALGVSIAIVCKEMLRLDSSVVTNLVYVLALLFTVDWNNLFLKHTLRFSKDMWWLLAFQVFIFLYAVIADASLMGSESSIVYTLYVIAYIIALLTNNGTIDGESFIKFIIVVTAFLNLIVFGLIVSGQTDLGSVYVRTLTYGTDRSSLSSVPLYYILAFICYKPRKLLDRIITILILFLSVYNMLACVRRTVYIIVIVCLIVWIVKSINFQSIERQKFIKCMVAIIIIICVFRIVYSIEWVQNIVNRSFESLTTGLATFFDDSAADASVTIRNTNRALAIQDYKENSIVQLIFGRGYAYMWIDLPFFEAFLDLGLIGGFAYLYFTGVLVVKEVLKKRAFTRGEWFIVFNAISVLISGFVSGMPYGYGKYCPIASFIFVIIMGKLGGETNEIVDDGSRNSMDDL